MVLLLLYAGIIKIIIFSFYILPSISIYIFNLCLNLHNYIRNCFYFSWSFCLRFWTFFYIRDTFFLWIIRCLCRSTFFLLCRSFCIVIFYKEFGYNIFRATCNTDSSSFIYISCILLLCSVFFNKNTALAAFIKLGCREILYFSAF